MILRVHVRRLLCLATLLGLILFGSCRALAASQINYDADLATLENRFFLHTFPDDSVSERLDRLDELVYGRVRQGSNETRMTSLLLALPSGASTQSQGATSDSSQTKPPSLESEKPVVAQAGSNSGSQGQASTAGTSDSAGPSNSSDASGSGKPDSGSSVAPDSTSSDAAADSTDSSESASNSGQSIDHYPTVTALERKITGKPEIDWPVQKRLARLESVAFGKPSSSNDLSHRVDLLKQYVRSKYGGSEDYLTSSNAVGWKNESPGLEAEVSSMEQEIFGKTYASDNLSSRLTRLEKNVLPKEPAQTFTPIAFRVNRLMAALNPKGSKWSTSSPGESGAVGQITPFTSSPSSYYPGQQSVLATAQNSKSEKSKHHSFLRRLGMVAGAVGGMAVRSMLYGGYGYW